MYREGSVSLTGGPWPCAVATTTDFFEDFEPASFDLRSSISFLCFCIISFSSRNADASVDCDDILLMSISGAFLCLYLFY